MHCPTNEEKLESPHKHFGHSLAVKWLFQHPSSTRDVYVGHSAVYCKNKNKLHFKLHFLLGIKKRITSKESVIVLFFAELESHTVGLDHFFFFRYGIGYLYCRGPLKYFILI